MATPTSLEASIAKLRHLFTTAERRVLDSAVGASVAHATEAQVKAALKQARVLRDKWRDLVGAQTRKAKRGGRRVGPYAVKASVPVNERSRDKSDLLASAVARLEARLAEFSGGAAAREAAKPARGATQPAATRSAKAAVVAPKKKAAAAASPAALTPRSISKKARQAGARKALESVRVQGLKTSSLTQRKAATALKAERLKLKGITTRRAGHAQARTGRAQARRDGRGGK